MRTRLALVTAALAATFAPAAFGPGFGDIEVNSALNQPLDAEIRMLVVKRGERDDVEIGLASPETFERFGIQRSPLMNDIRVETVPGDEGAMRVLLTTRRPIREPFVTLLLEARWSGRRALREYTILLDPPVRTPVAGGEAGEGAREDETVSTEPAPAPARATERTAAPQAAPRTRAPASPESYGPVEPNQTLWSIAYEMRPSRDISMDKMLLAIYRANPDAFGGNMNLLHKGAMLSIPAEDEVRRIDASAAAAEVADQKREFARLQDESRPADSGDAEKDRPTPVAAAPEAESRGELRLEPAGDADGSGRGTAGSEDGAAGDGTVAAPGETAPQTGEKEPAAAERHAEAQPGDTSDAADTGTQPETGADAQTQAAGDDRAAMPGKADTGERAGGEEPVLPTVDTIEAGDGAAGAPAGDSGGDAPADDEPERAVAAAETAPGRTGGGEDGNEPIAPAADEAEPGGAGDETTSDSVGADAGTGDTAEPDEMETAAAEAGAESLSAGARAPASPDENASATGDGPDVAVETGARSVVPDSVALFTPRRLLLVLAAVLLVLCLVLVLRRRQYKPVPADFSGLGETEASTSTDAGDAPSAAAAGTAAEPAQGVEEILDDADGLIQSGRHDEAVGALELGLDAHPDDPRLQRKILEAHHAAGHRDAFVDKARRFHPSPDPADPDWRAVAALGAQLAPEEPMFSAGGSGTGVGSSSPRGDDAGEAVEDPRLPDADLEAYAVDDLSEAGGTDETGASDREHLERLLDSDSDEDEREDIGDTASSPEGEAESPETASGDEGVPAGDDASADDKSSVLTVDPAEFGLEEAPDEQPDDADTGADTAKGPRLGDYDLSGLSLDETSDGDAEGTDDDTGDPTLPGVGESGGETETRPDEGRVEAPDMEASEGDFSAGGTAAGPASEGATSADAESSVSPPDGDDEVATKLDLARAYLDMGEPDMAASLLEEVRQQGDEAQRREAGNLLTRAR